MKYITYSNKIIPKLKNIFCLIETSKNGSNFSNTTLVVKIDMKLAKIKGEIKSNLSK